MTDKPPKQAFPVIRRMYPKPHESFQFGVDPLRRSPDYTSVMRKTLPMPTFRSEIIFEGERLMIDPAEWDTRDDIPAEALRLAKEESATGVPTGITNHPKYGWMVLQTSGQGPYLIWTEQKLPFAHAGKNVQDRKSVV